MNNNMFMALATSVLNACAVVVNQLIGIPDIGHAIMAFTGLASPFLSIFLLKLYIKADDPPELVRQIAALKSSIKICKGHLKEKGASSEFLSKTREQLEDFQYKLQNARSDFEKGRTHAVTPIAPPESQ